MKDKGIRTRIQGRKKRKTPPKFDKRRYNRRNRIESMFGRLKGWRRVEIHYDRRAKALRSANALAPVVARGNPALCCYPAEHDLDLIA